MSAARYFIPEHHTLKEVYSKAELRGMLQSGTLSRSDMVTDDDTGIAYLLGDLLMMPFPDVVIVPARTTNSLQHAPALPLDHEFRADTPLPKGELDEELTDDDEEEEDELEEEAGEDDLFSRIRPEPDGEEEEDQTDDEAGDAPDEDEEDVRAPMRPLAGITPDVPIEMDDEEVEEEAYLFVGHPSWLAFPKALLLAAVCLGSALFFYQHNVSFEWITLPGSVAGLVLLFISLDRSTTTYIVTDRRVEMEFGIIGRNTKEVRICDIRAIDVVQRGFDAVIGVGTVKFDSSASSGPEVCFRHVRRPHAIKQLVRELQG